VLPVTAFILAGGKSARMGTDKAFLEVAGRSLLDHALAIARAAVADVRIIGDPAKFAAFAPAFRDVYPARGPLGGIHAALSNSTTDSNLILAVDLPFLGAGFLQYLIAESQSVEGAVTLPSASGHLHTLCAVYRKQFLPHAERALAEGRNKVDALFAEVQVRIIAEAELSAAGFKASIFRNLNTREDWEQAKLQFR